MDDGSTSPDRATTEITALLHAHAAGDAAALDQLLPRVYGELRRIARLRLRRERDAHTLAATDLVHEAYLKLLPVERVDWRSRAHFFAIASRAMRNVLVDHAVRRGAAKRGAGATVLALDDSSAAARAAARRSDRARARRSSASNGWTRGRRRSSSAASSAG